MSKTDTKPIPDGWKETTLGALVTFQRGHDLPRSKMVDGSFPIMGSNGIIGFHNQSTTKAPGVTIGRSGNIGRAFLVKRDYWAHNTTLYSKQFHDSDPVFVYYLVKNLKFERFNSGSAVPSLNRNFIHPIQLNAPIIFEQKAIARVLSSLDDKIELLRKQNETLEAIAQTIFKEWFVNFNFPDKNGKPFKDGGGKMIDSELGPIPNGWRVESLSRIADFLNGLALQKYPPESETQFLPVIKIRELKSGISGQTDKASTAIDSKYIVKNGDVLFSWSGSLAIVVWKYGNGALNQHLFKVTSKTYHKWFYYYWVKHHLLDFRQIAANKATTMGHIQRHHLDEARVLIPNDTTMIRANDLIGPNLEKQIANDQQINTLTQLRDTLLPKLMSGQVRVKGI